MNIRFEYLYRDSGNFKNWGDVVFKNPRSISAASIAEMADNILIDHSFFVATKAGIPDLHFPKHDEELDHGWHEAYAFLTTGDKQNDPHGRDIETFIASLRLASQT